MTRKRAVIFGLVTTVFISVAANIAYFQVKQLQPVLAATPAPGFYKVVRDVDGDTIIVNMDGKDESVRFIGVDTPETHKPNSPVQCFGPQASDFTKQHVQGSSVRLVADPTNDNRDRYGRLLRYVFLTDGTLLNKALIEQGYGFAYLSFPFQKHDEFAQAQADARAVDKGLWAACQTYQLNGERWQTNDLRGG